MMNAKSKTYELLVDMTKLLKKYGRDPFSELAILLKDQDFVNDLSEVLSETSKMPSRPKKAKERPSPQEEAIKFRQSLVELSSVEPEKSKILLALFDALHDRKALPSLREVNNFVSDQGLAGVTGKSRDKVILTFLKRCLGLPVPDLEALAVNLSQKQHLQASDRSLEGWGKVILDRSNR